MTDWALAVDFGTSNTVAVLRRPDGRTGAVLFDGSPLLPSAVYVDPAGALLTGRDAVHSARLAPERFEPNPKLRVDEGSVLLGVEVPVVDLFAAVLARVLAEAQRIACRAPASVVLTHPAGWGTRRRAVLEQAALKAGMTAVSLMSEPVAAARYFLAEHPQPGHDDATDTPMVVYDLGAGTLDVSVLAGGQVLANDGLTDVGGLDIDAALLAHLMAANAGRDPEGWARIRVPQTVADRRALRQLRDDVRTAKEMLSRTAQTFVPLPFGDQDVPVGKDQLDAIAEPLIARTVATTRAALRNAGVPLPPPGPLYLVGGASRMPLVATLLQRRLEVAPTVTEQPELVVAHGALAEVPGRAPRHADIPLEVSGSAEEAGTVGIGDSERRAQPDGVDAAWMHLPFWQGIVKSLFRTLRKGTLAFACLALITAVLLTPGFAPSISVWRIGHPSSRTTVYVSTFRILAWTATDSVTSRVVISIFGLLLVTTLTLLTLLPYGLRPGKRLAGYVSIILTIPIAGHYIFSTDYSDYSVYEELPSGYDSYSYLSTHAGVGMWLLPAAMIAILCLYTWREITTRRRPVAVSTEA